MLHRLLVLAFGVQGEAQGVLNLGVLGVQLLGLQKLPEGRSCVPLLEIIVPQAVMNPRPADFRLIRTAAAQEEACGGQE